MSSPLGRPPHQREPEAGTRLLRNGL